MVRRNGQKNGNTPPDNDSPDSANLLKKHPNATTTLAIRYAIQTAPKHFKNVELAKRFGISPRTVARWRGRNFLFDRSSATEPHGRQKLSQEVIEKILDLRKREKLALDPLHKAIAQRYGINVSRSWLAKILAKNQSIL